MSLNILKYEAPPRVRAEITRMAISFIFAVCVIGFLIGYVIIPEINSGEIYEEYRWLGFIILMLMLLGGFYVVIARIISFWTDSISVEIGDEDICGYNMWNQPNKIRIDEIVVIRKTRRFRCIVLIDKYGHKFVIDADIEYFGECVEKITRLAKNVKVVDYKGINRDPMLWRRSR